MEIKQIIIVILIVLSLGCMMIFLNNFQNNKTENNEKEQIVTIEGVVKSVQENAIIVECNQKLYKVLLKENTNFISEGSKIKITYSGNQEDSNPPIIEAQFIEII